MLTLPKRIAPEPFFSAYLALLHHVLLQVRAMTEHPDTITAGQVSQINQLADAVHNIPEMLLDYGYYWTAENLWKDRIEPYDRSHADQNNPLLSSLLQEFLAAVKARGELT